MAREVTHEATGPLRIDEAEIVERGGSVLLCRCGLSAEYPFCDGSHETTYDETEGRLYRYEEDDGRHEIEVVVIDGDDETGDDAGERDGEGEKNARGDDSESETEGGDRVR